MKIYLASRFGRRDEMREYEKELKNAGHVCTANWLWAEEPDERDGGGMRAISDEDKARYAIVDMEDVAKSDVLVAFTEAPGVEGGSRGGRHVEFGAALAFNKEVLIVGPRENIFHYLPGLRQFDSFDKALKALEAF